MREKLAGLGFETQSSSPPELSAFLRRESDKWAKVVKASGARAEGIGFGDPAAQEVLYAQAMERGISEVILGYKRDPQVGLVAEQLVRGPQAGESRADDRDVGPGVAVDRPQSDLTALEVLRRPFTTRSTTYGDDLCRGRCAFGPSLGGVIERSLSVRVASSAW